MNKNLELISGTFENGCGVIIRDEDNNYYHVVVYKDRVVIDGMEYTKKDLKQEEAHMENLTHLFSVGQKVRCKMDETFYKGTVTETHTDHIIIDIPEVSNHC